MVVHKDIGAPNTLRRRNEVCALDVEYAGVGDWVQDLAWVMAKMNAPTVIASARDAAIDRMRRVDPALVHGAAEDLAWAFRLQQVPLAVGRTAEAIQRLSDRWPDRDRIAPTLLERITPLVTAVRTYLGDGKPMDSPTIRDTLLRRVPPTRINTIIDIASPGLRPASGTLRSQNAGKSAPSLRPPASAGWLEKAKNETAKVPKPQRALKRDKSLG